MRFLIAIGVFTVAAVLLGVGVVQKVFFAGDEYTTLTTTVEPNAPYLVIDGKTLTLHGTNPVITVSGAKETFVGFGRTEDVAAWIGTDDYDVLKYSTKKSDFVFGEGKSKVVEPANLETPALTEQPILTPAGSDLWLGEMVGKSTATLPTFLDNGMSAIIASNGTADAPGNVTIAWPLPSRIPFATGFIIGGGALALVGLVLYLWALRHDRNSQGPRRRGKLPKPPKPRALRMPTPKSLVSAAPKGRRGISRGSSFIALGLAGVLTVGLSSCSPYNSGQGVVQPTPTATQSVEIDGQPPAVTERQLQRILSKISETVTAADVALDPALSATRLIGPAQEIRAANYSIRKTDSSVAALPELAASPITFTMPQATATWPRQVIAVVQNEQDPSVPTMGIMMIQNSPRENYHVEYMVTLEPNAQVPTVAPANVGSALVPADSKLLLISPDQLSAAYGSVLTQGAESPYYGLFDFTSDTLVTQVGKDYKSQKAASVAENASLEFSQNSGSGQPLGLATMDSGAIVTVGLNEVETVRPTQTGASVSPEGLAKILSGVSTSTTGIESTYGLELAFYVPPLGSKDKIRLLGYTQGLISARGL
ncbi:hypothetical protein M2118_000417 [Aurantimicrobium minutum]|uniref:hypothetical protein n=1 Tax=Aurantimicrobium minutum TaxID=708131 RepID=UPI002474920E|nr:hypothetical protein [Aurantimicrobium minutum]MDH6277466.1 hypothetical protein [Aurantimicrobium minutum]